MRSYYSQCFFPEFFKLNASSGINLLSLLTLLWWHIILQYDHKLMYFYCDIIKLWFLSFLCHLLFWRVFFIFVFKVCLYFFCFEKILVHCSFRSHLLRTSCFGCFTSPPSTFFIHYNFEASLLYLLKFMKIILVFCTFTIFCIYHNISLFCHLTFLYSPQNCFWKSPCSLLNNFVFHFSVLSR